MRRIAVGILLITLFFTLPGCYKNEKRDENRYSISSITGEQEEMVNIILYFPDSNAEYLIPETRLVKFNKSLENTVIKELLNGPSATDIESPIPEGTRLISIDRKGDRVTLNFSKEFIKNHPGGSTGETMTIFSIVNSLTEIPGIKEVLFKVNGKAYETLAGHMIFNEPFKRNRSLFKRGRNLNPSQVLKKQMELEKQGKWLEAYLLMSDDENNPDRKYYHDYVKEMEEVKGLGFTQQDFVVGGYTIEKGSNRASVKVNFYIEGGDGSKQPGDDLYFNCVNIEEVWMVDWLTSQDMD
ncbi:GerMN domain-containing protein [Fonticella tunisiensis]|uniref:Sporulation and spore germination protein n=1 Tax=Fonticella tunisiensis TaxID=1096341 RepID=A0A4R7K7P4_9CLOT|nr:GerMN domain-containing protein [Fonticella tunisiensis]TDT45994.1 sporulation and spore germination protein [Fonticella tunisiensis]